MVTDRVFKISKYKGYVGLLSCLQKNVVSAWSWRDGRIVKGKENTNKA
jgi:hypothetical protein